MYDGVAAHEELVRASGLESGGAGLWIVGVYLMHDMYIDGYSDEDMPGGFLTNLVGRVREQQVGEGEAFAANVENDTILWRRIWICRGVHARFVGFMRCALLF